MVLGSWYLARPCPGSDNAKYQVPRADFLIIAGSCGRKLLQWDLGRFDLYGFLQLGRFHVPNQTHGAQNADAVPVEVDLIPGQAVTRRLRVGVVIVVPAFA